MLATILSSDLSFHAMNRMIYILSFLLLFLNCSKEKDIEIVENGDSYFKLSQESNATLEVPYRGGTYTLFYETNIEETLYSRVTASVEGGAGSWCKASVDRDSKNVKIEVAYNENSSPREATILLKIEEFTVPIEIIQQEFISTEIGEKWEKVEILSGWAPDYITEDNKIEKAFDGDVTTYFNSKAGEVQYPYEVKFTLNTTRSVTHLIYYPRRDSGTRWGQFGEFEVWYNTSTNSDFVKAGSFDFKEELNDPSTAWFETPIDSPNEILIKVLSGYNNRVSIGEIEFYSESGNSFDYSSIFNDKACSELRPDVTMQDIEAIPEPFYKDLAQRIFAGTYDSEFRVQKYRPYQHPNFAAAELKTGKYSLRDNATGMFYDNFDENLIVFVDDLNEQSISLNIIDFQESANEGVSYPLNEGVNVLKPSKKGLIYILYHVDDPLPLNPSSDSDKRDIDKRAVKVHIASGRVNGYFDIRKHDNNDWKSIRDNASAAEIDVLGLHSHVVWNVKDYQDYDTDIVLMTNYIDNLVKQQHEFMGLYHYNRSFKNRHFIRVDYHVPAAYATDYRTVYKNTLYKEVFCSEDGFRRRLWVLGHEVGHVNQTRPGLKWHGTTEVTNNIYALYNQKMVHGEARRLTTGEGRQGYSSGNDGYDVAFERIIDAKRDWYIGGENFSSNYIPRLAPFWQLYLYLVQIEKQEHFYHDLFEYLRTHASPSDEGERQLDFVRQVCHVSQLNLLGFFEKWGFLTPINLDINDYGVRRIRITESQIANLKSEVISKGYKEPTINVHELTDTNYKQFIK